MIVKIALVGKLKEEGGKKAREERRMDMARPHLHWESSTTSKAIISSSNKQRHNSQIKNKQQMLCLLQLPKGGRRKPPPCPLIFTSSSATTLTTITAASSSNRAQLESKKKQQWKSKPSSSNESNGPNQRKGRGGGAGGGGGKKGRSNDEQLVGKKGNSRDEREMSKSGKPTRHYRSSEVAQSDLNSSSNRNSNSDSSSDSSSANSSRRGGGIKEGGPFEQGMQVGGGERARKRSLSKPTPLPSPPAGFIVDANGKLSLMAPPERRIAIIVDPSNGLALECMIRRVFEIADGRQSFLMCPLDMPLQILKVEDEGDGVSDLDDQEMEEILPTVAYELAKRRLHLVFSGLCLTARGGFRYTEDDIIDLNTEFGQEDAGGSLSEGVEIAKFKFKGVEHLIFSPLDPLLFVACKNRETGELVLAEDDVIEDRAVLDAFDEEKEFDLLVEEEIAINASLEAEAYM